MESTPLDPATVDDLQVIQAAPADLARALAIEENATSWVRSLGIDPGEPPRPLAELYALRLGRGEVYFGVRAGVPIAMLTLQWLDRLMWPEAPEDAAYVHGLMVHRDAAGQRVGERLIDWAGHQARIAGKAYVRLDCQVGNAALRAYYERLGFTYRGDMTFVHYVAARYERPVEEESDASGTQ
jgi:GNAT superfamily N-acetyltransferase